MALNCEAKVMQRIEEICKGEAEKSMEMQWHGYGTALRRGAKEKQGREWNSKGYEMQGVELISEGKECSEANRDGKG